MSDVSLALISSWGCRRLTIFTETRRTYRAVFSEPRVVIPPSTVPPDLQTEQAELPNHETLDSQEKVLEEPSPSKTAKTVPPPLDTTSTNGTKRPHEEGPSVVGDATQPRAASAGDGVSKKKRKKLK